MQRVKLQHVDIYDLHQRHKFISMKTANHWTVHSVVPKMFGESHFHEKRCRQFFKWKLISIFEFISTAHYDNFDWFYLSKVYHFNSSCEWIKHELFSTIPANERGIDDDDDDDGKLGKWERDFPPLSRIFHWKFLLISLLFLLFWISPESASVASQCWDFERYVRGNSVQFIRVIKIEGKYFIKKGAKENKNS